MPRPKVTFTWSVPENGRGARATCNLRCGFLLESYSRNGLYPSTAQHKKDCPRLTDPEGRS